MMMTTKNVLIAAVGGQGALLSARIIAHFACEQGLDVKVSEIHGMSQRGGGVVSHVRYGMEVHSPVIEAGTADVVLGLEALEAARHAPMLKQDGVLIMNTQEIRPMPVLTGAAVYPSDLLERLSTLPVRVRAIDGLQEAAAAGNVKTVNTVLLGVLAREIGAEASRWRRAVAACVRDEHQAANLAAFDRGFALEATRPQEAAKRVGSQVTEGITAPPAS